MKRWRVVGTAVVGLVGMTLGAGLRAPAGGEAEINWLADWETARAAARQSGKPLFVAFR